jgi:hypothetical protein
MHAKTLSAVTAAIVSGLVLAQPATAASDEKFPAADFQPKVVYQDKTLIGQVSSDSKYAGSSSSASKSEAGHPADPKYPAAYFTPSVIHPK